MASITALFETQLYKQIRLPYWLFLPTTYGQHLRSWPLILFLHGSGERGNDLSLVMQRGLPKEVQQRADFPFVVVAPQCPAQTIWSVHLDALHSLLTAIITTYPVDPDQIAITGLSMGGSGAWHMAVTYPNMFSALVPMCGDDYWCIRGPEQVQSLRDLPIWAFHGRQDSVIPVAASERLVRAVKSIGGTAKLTLYSDVGHNCYNEAYATDELYTWLLRQRRHLSETSD